MNICNTLGGRFAQFILQRLLCPFQVVLLQEGKDGLQVQGLFYYLFHFIFLPRLKLPPKIYFLIIPPNLLAFTCIVEDSTRGAAPPSPGSAFTSVLICCSLTLTWLEADPGEMAGERWGDGANPEKIELVSRAKIKCVVVQVPRVFEDGAITPGSRGEAWLEPLFWKSPPSRLPPPWGS